ncbi:odorant receptor 4-like [Leptidea sinapis]|uniref:odorant receptor 4-like n=1 Tax=Leptidea sinapis TaxID=189913 RepID=UPI0021C2BDBD|nr:odorant receptor 4-like [Leptidea sinapis]
MLSIVCIVKSNSFFLWQGKWKEVIDYVTEADKCERDDKDTLIGKIIKKYTSYCRYLVNFYWCLVAITAVTVIGTPLIRYVSSETYRQALQNGTELFPHIFSAWTPWDRYQSPGTWVNLIFQTMMCICGAGIMANFDTCTLVIMVFFGGKFELLKARCEIIFTGDTMISDEEGNTRIHQLHAVHVALMKHIRIFDSLLSPVMFFYVVVCSLMLCVSAFELTTATDTTQKMLTAEYLTFGVAQLFMFCWHSNQVLAKSSNVSLGPYQSAWWQTSVPQRRNILNLLGQLRATHTFHAGPFTDLTLSTFVSILKGAYSFYTLLK